MIANTQQADLAALDLQSFAKAWVAQLIERGVDGVRPHEPGNRKGFDRVVAVLDESIEDFVADGYSKSAILPLLQIANELRPSPAGDYEGFELALRSLQLTFTASPNPWYDYISFPISKTHAESFVERLPDIVRGISGKAAEAFTATGEFADVGGVASRAAR